MTAPEKALLIKKRNGQMIIKKQVCSLDQAKQLKELGVPQKSWLYWHVTKNAGIMLSNSGIFRTCFNNRIETEDRYVTSGSEVYAAFTDAELEREILQIIGDNFDFVVSFSPTGGVWKGETFDEMYEVQLVDWYNREESIMERAAIGADAKAKILIYLLKNKLPENKCQKIKSCKTCKYRDSASFDTPCLTCSRHGNFNNWEDENIDKK